MFGKIITGVAILTLAVGTYIGEKYEPIEIITNHFRYHNVIAAKNTPQDFWNYKTKIEIDSNNVATLYFGNQLTNQFKKVKSNGNVGSVGESIDQFLDDKKKQLSNSSFYKGAKKELEDFKRNINQQLEDMFR